MKKKSAPTFDNYVHAPDCARHLAGLELPPELWAVFALAAKPIAADEIGRRLGLAPAVAQAALGRLARRKLVRKHVIAWADYVAGNSVPAVSVPEAARVIPFTPVASAVAFPRHAPAPTPAPAAPASLAPAEPAPQNPRPDVAAAVDVATSNVASRTPEEIRFALRNPAADVRRAALREQLVRVTIVKKPTVSSGRKLRPIIDAIMQKGGGGLNGQLLVYRVFMRVPAELIAACGLRSLKLVDPDFEIKDDRLHQAIEAAARDVAGIGLLPWAA